MNALKSISILGFALAVAALAAQPSYAQSHSRSGGGGAHFSGGGSAHFSGGSRLGPAHSGGVRFNSPAQNGAHRVGGYATGINRPGFGRSGSYGHGWYGGYWGGRYWPGAGFRSGFSWFLPVLPLGFATYWWGGLPYYYYDDAYYMWSPSYNGYVATDPPPVTQDDSQSADNAANDSTPRGAIQADSTQGSADVFAYPKNGQSAEQAAKDRSDCRAWAVGETGFDPTRTPDSQTSASNYQRAMGACLDARGYSTR